jgi:Zn-dependent peptidase ImmA (M78 family)/DNA-binding XRE family transcriptional regulator
MDAVFIGPKLRLARNFYGLSLEEVGESVAATRQYIQQIESGAKQPTEEMMLALSDALGVYPEFFFEPETSSASEELCHFRSLRTTPINIKNQALSHATILDWLVNELDDVLDFPDINLPHDTPSSLGDIDRIAEDARKVWGLGTSGPITHMVRVAENAGIIVAHFKNVSEKIDAFSMHGRRPVVIRNPYKESVCRMRFDIAHECGHLIMHQGMVTGDKRTEDEANRFASAFLLPRAAFLQEFPRAERFQWPAIFKLKLRWKVSVAAIIRRAYDLSIIDAAAYRRANVYLSKTGQSKAEKYDDRPDLIPPEEPELIYNAFETIQNQAPEMLDSIQKKLGVRRSVIENLINKKLPEKSFETYGGNVVTISSIKSNKD